MRVLDLYSGAGGAGHGYHQAGYEVIGVDIAPQPRYPHEFWRADALTILGALLDGKTIGLPEGQKYRLTDFDLIHTSPPCQAFSLAQRIQNREHPDLIEPTRELLKQTGIPWVIENVNGAPLHQPIELCGTMFPELRVYRHRVFETSFTITQPKHPPHEAPLQKNGTPARTTPLHARRRKLLRNRTSQNRNGHPMDGPRRTPRSNPTRIHPMDRRTIP